MTPSTKRELLSPRAFGEALGVTRQAVQKAIKVGRIAASLSKDERTGHHLIELQAGRQEWEAWADPAKRPKDGARKPSGRPAAAAQGTPSLFEKEQVRERLAGQITHARASAERTMIDAELMRMELDERRGRLIDRGEVQREAFRLGRLLRSRIQAIPDRIAATLAATDKVAQVHQLLAAEIANALEAFERKDAAADG